MRIISKLCALRQIRMRIVEQRQRLYRVAYAWCGDHYLADDLVQEALTRAIEKSGQLRDMAKLDSWIYSIMNNCWREYLRRKRPTEELDEQLLSDFQCPAQINFNSDMVRKVFELMELLPIGQRQVLSLVVLEEFSYRDVADLLDIPIGTVMSRLSRARRFLAGQIQVITPSTTVRTVKLKQVK